MSNLRNKVILIGNLGAKPELTTLENNKCYVRVSLATSSTYKNDKKEKVVQTEWHNLTFWNKTAEIVSEYCDKGSEIAIEGKLTTSSFEDVDGVKRWSTQIIVNELVMLGSKK